jgi:hypothetical protein
MPGSQISQECKNYLQFYISYNTTDKINHLRNNYPSENELITNEIELLHTQEKLEDLYKSCNFSHLLRTRRDMSPNTIKKYIKSKLPLIKALKEELGASPSEKTKDLYEFYKFLEYVFTNSAFEMENIESIRIRSAQNRPSSVRQQPRQQPIRHNSSSSSSNNSRERQPRNIRLLNSSSSSSSDELVVPSRPPRQPRQPSRPPRQPPRQSRQIQLLPEVDDEMQEINPAQPSLPMNTLAEQQFIAGLNMLLMNNFNDLYYYMPGYVQEIKNEAIFMIPNNDRTRINRPDYYAQLLQTLTDWVNTQQLRIHSTPQLIKTQIKRQIAAFKLRYFEALHPDNYGGNKGKKILKKNK